jgi:hypothetical protein
MNVIWARVKVTHPVSNNQTVETFYFQDEVELDRFKDWCSIGFPNIIHIEEEGFCSNIYFRIGGILAELNPKKES